MAFRSFSSALLNTKKFQLIGVWPLQGICFCTASSYLCQNMIKLLVFLNKFCFWLWSIIRKHMSAFQQLCVLFRMSSQSELGVYVAGLGRAITCSFTIRNIEEVLILPLCCGGHPRISALHQPTFVKLNLHQILLQRHQR